MGATGAIAPVDFEKGLIAPVDFLRRKYVIKRRFDENSSEKVS